MEYADICEVKEVGTLEELNKYLHMKDAHWVLLAVAPGQDENRSPIFAYSIGKTGRADAGLEALRKSFEAEDQA